MAEFYQVRIDFKLSKNFNSIGGEITYGREAKSKETREQLVKDVNSFAEKKFFERIKFSDSILNEVATK